MIKYHPCKNAGCPFCGCMSDNTCKLPNVAENAPWMILEYGEALLCKYGKAFVMDFMLTAPVGTNYLEENNGMDNNKNDCRSVLTVSGVYQFTEEEQAGNCPTCGADVMDSYNKNFCGKCGQRLIWKEEIVHINISNNKEQYKNAIVVGGRGSGKARRIVIPESLIEKT